MQVEWTDFAWKMLSQTADDILMEFGYQSYCKFLDDVDAHVMMLIRFPKSGKEEPFLMGRPLLYRSLVVDALNKIIYTINEETEVIYITDFWDVRREPKLLIDSV